jgi:protein-tyrosine-phosphatase
MAAAFAAASLAGRSEDVSVASAGILEPGVPPTSDVIRVMARRGLDVAGHRSRRLAESLDPVPSLVVAMGREHARAVVEQVPSLFPRTFTLKDLAGRTSRTGPRMPGEDLDDYLHRLGDGRGLWNLAGASATDDVADPIGGGLAACQRCSDEIERLVVPVVEHLWPSSR